MAGRFYIVMAPQSRAQLDSQSDSQRSTRRRFIAASGTAGATALAGCAGVFGGGGSGTIKVGLALPFSGPLAFQGEDMRNGIKLRLENELGGEVDGNEVEFVERDTAAKPSKAVSVTRDLLEKEDPDIYMGPDLSSSAVAVAPLLEKRQDEIVWLNPTSSNINLTRKYCLKNHFRTGRTSWHAGAPIGPYVANELEADTVALMYHDYVGGQQVTGAFERSYTKAGGEIIERVTAPIGTTDFSSQLTKLEESGADAVFAFILGASAISFVKQYDQFGLKDKMTLTGHGTMSSPTTFPAQGDAALDVISLNFYTATSDRKQNKEFVQAYKDAYDAGTNSYSCAGYDCGQAVEKGVKQGGTAADGIIGALEGATLPSPRGYFKYSEQTHDPIMNMDIRRAVNGDGDTAHNRLLTVVEKAKAPTWGCNVQG